MINKTAGEFAKTMIGKAREFTKNTVSAAEFVADTASLETKHFAHRALRKISHHFTGPTVTPPRDASLDPLAGVMDDPLSR